MILLLQIRLELRNSIMTEDTVKLKLDLPLIGIDGQPRKNGSRMRDVAPYDNMNNVEFKEFLDSKSTKQIKELLPNETISDGIKFILSNCIEAKNNEDAAKSFTYITKINNVSSTAEQEWSFHKDELKKFKDFLATASKNINPFYSGQIDSILDKLYAEITLK